jgi:hypothetical protein
MRSNLRNSSGYPLDAWNSNGVAELPVSRPVGLIVDPAFGVGGELCMIVRESL